MQRYLLGLPIVLFCLVAAMQSGASEYYFDYNNNCREAYSHFMALRSDLGHKLIAKDAKVNPNNLMHEYLKDYDDCLLLLFNGDEQDYRRLKDNLGNRIDHLDNGDKDSPWYRLCKSGVYLHWAFVSIRYGDNLKAAGLFRKSFALIKDNKELFPDFEYNDVFYGLEEAALGAIPNDYKWIASIFGLKGDVKNGIAKLDRFVNAHKGNDLLFQEAYLYRAYLRFYLMSDKDGVWQEIKHINAGSSLLLHFLKINLALNNRHADYALEVLRDAAKLPQYASFPVMEYELAQAQYYKLDTSCIMSFKRFLGTYKGKLFVKDAHKKIALSYFLTNDIRAAQKYRDAIKRVGSTVVDADKQAMRFAKDDSWPNKSLYKASLLVDGGYYSQAHDMLGRYYKNGVVGVANKLEYAFWMGRVLDELGNKDEAIRYYRQAIKIGRDRRERFAARSALQIGFIYEDQGKRASAILMYKQVLSMEDHDYKNSIDQQAKAGINRLSR